MWSSELWPSCCRRRCRRRRRRRRRHPEVWGSPLSRPERPAQTEHCPGSLGRGSRGPTGWTSSLFCGGCRSTPPCRARRWCSTFPLWRWGAASTPPSAAPGPLRRRHEERESNRTCENILLDRTTVLMIQFTNYFCCFSLSYTVYVEHLWVFNGNRHFPPFHSQTVSNVSMATAGGDHRKCN